jgi:FtsP/CotA-like multicopper oxidase with cupredoxin domain
MLHRTKTVAVSTGIWVVALVAGAHAKGLVPQTPLDGTCVPRFATELPVFGPAGSTPRVNALHHRHLKVTMKEIDQPSLPVGMQDTCGKGITFGETRVWAYESADAKTGQILGPANWPAVTLEARRYVPTRVDFVNRLPSFNPANPTGPGLVQAEMLIDQTVHWADPLQAGCGMPLDCTNPANATSPCCQPFTGPMPATVHLHGGELPACVDGGPETWFTPNGITGPGFCTVGWPSPGKAIYSYDNAQEPGTLWFHDHALGTTRNSVFAGLAGFYFVRDPAREPRKLPSGPYEIELALQDRKFDTNSQLYFVPPDEYPYTPRYHPFWLVFAPADVITVNGAAWPYLNVEPRRYRFRILNGANSRRFDLQFGKVPVYQIGADDNYLDEPVKVNGRACAGAATCSDVSLAPGERADVIVDFSKLAGQTVTLGNSASDKLPVMQFRVVLPIKGCDESCDPAKPDPWNGICARPKPLVRLTDGEGNIARGVTIDRVRQLVTLEQDTKPNTLDSEITDFLQNTYWDGRESPSIEAEFPTDGISELPRVGSTELWEIINTSMGGHPIHTHLVQFQVLNREAFDNSKYTAAWNGAFGTGPVPLPTDCTAGQYCAGYGPPLSYTIPNADGAIGGNPAVGPYLSGHPMPPDPGETGWKDTIKAFPGQVTRILVRWTPTTTSVIPHYSWVGHNLFPFDPTQGNYVWHCHLLNHEDNEMMRPYRVVK